MAQEMGVTTSMQHMLRKPKRLVAVKPIKETVTYLPADSRDLLLKTFVKQASFEGGLLLKTFAKQAISEMEEREQRNRILSRILVPRVMVEATNAKDVVSFYKAAFGAKEFSQCLLRKEPDLAAEMNLHGIYIQIYQRANVVKEDKFKGAFVLHVRDTDAAVARAVEAGAVALGEAFEVNHEYQGLVMDPYGYRFRFISLAKNPPMEFVMGLRGAFSTRYLYDCDGKF